ncbi:hypothetical protein RB195_002700 [Necator americanus]|uniref:Protein kinase domain-containing protein n=1 Tax=Necator americanus TaxID=51031 RepID=A0ABR1DKZ8_NECAM
MDSNEDSDDREEDVFILKKGFPIRTRKATYFVQSLIGEGTFGAVYRVIESTNDSKIHAMKIEKKTVNTSRSKLKTEIRILRLLANKMHFAKLIDEGCEVTFSFLIMDLLGKNLADLKKTQPNEGGHQVAFGPRLRLGTRHVTSRLTGCDLSNEENYQIFSLATGLNASSQCLEACRDLHNVGFIHRDVKPANFACGIEDRIKVIFMLDFGLSKNLRPEIDEEVSQAHRFKGTIRYASLACHKCEDMGPRDDCESWFYMMVDFVSPLSLPWRNAKNRRSVLRMKEEIHRDKMDWLLCGLKCKRSFAKIIKYIDGLKTMDPVDYTFLLKSVEEGAKEAKCDLSAPYDWEITSQEVVESLPNLSCEWLQDENK